jgi:CheY-like chemotaxis protein
MATQLFVGNLTSDTLEADLRAVFVANGFEVGSMKMVKDPETGRPRGFAYVELASAAAIPEALERMDRKDVKGRAISIRAVKPVNYKPPSPRPTAGAQAAIPKQILLIEDDHDVREVSSMALTEAGYVVIEAKNGHDALETLQAGVCRPTTILLDVTMPLMDGHGFMSELRRHPALSAIGVVLTSAQDDISGLAAALGLRDFLRKPFGLNQLLETVARVDQRGSALAVAQAGSVSSAPPDVMAAAADTGPDGAGGDRKEAQP